MYLVLDISELVNWISLSIFVFKMESIRIRLQNTTMKDFQKNRMRNKKLKRASILFLIIYCLYAIGIETNRIINLPDFDPLPIRIVNNIFRVLKFMQDMWLYWLFSRDFIFFFRLKVSKNENENITPFNIIIMSFAFILMLLSMAHSFFALIVDFFATNAEAQLYFRFVDRNIIPGKDFLISTIMLYLFYYQSSKTKKSSKKSKK